MNYLKLAYTILALGILTITSCSKSTPVIAEPEQNHFCGTAAYFNNWGKHRNYINPENITAAAPYNLYDNTTGTAASVRQISTAEGPRYAMAQVVADYFNGDDWTTVFAPLANPEHAADLAKLQSGNYLFNVKDYNGNRYFEARTVERDIMEFVFEVTLL